MPDVELTQDIGASESERTQALERFYVIRPFLEDSVPLAQIARERAIPRWTLTRWVKQYRETSLGGLIRQGRADKGERRNMPPNLKLLIGMPGIEKRLARYPQLYSRVGFVHQFHSLSTEEVRFILEHKWQQIGVRLQPDDFSDMEAVATVIRITGGNFRLIHRLCTQIERILHINEIRMVTKEVVEAAREQLVIGQV
jgi:hypothetical protein